jgi:hypothetical protein
LAFDDIEIIKSMNEHCIGFVSEIICSCDCIVECDAYQSDIEPLPSVVAHTVYLEFGSDLRHKNSALYFEFVAAVGNSLRMVARTCSHHPPCFLLLCQIEEGSACTPQLEASDILQVLSLEEHISIVFLR